MELEKELLTHMRYVLFTGRDLIEPLLSFDDADQSIQSSDPAPAPDSQQGDPFSLIWTYQPVEVTQEQGLRSRNHPDIHIGKPAEAWEGRVANELDQIEESKAGGNIVDLQPAEEAGGYRGGASKESDWREDADDGQSRLNSDPDRPQIPFLSQKSGADLQDKSSSFQHAETPTVTKQRTVIGVRTDDSIEVAGDVGMGTVGKVRDYADSQVHDQSEPIQAYFPTGLDEDQQKTGRKASDACQQSANIAANSDFPISPEPFPSHIVTEDANPVNPTVIDLEPPLSIADRPEETFPQLRDQGEPILAPGLVLPETTSPAEADLRIEDLPSGLAIPQPAEEGKDIRTEEGLPTGSELVHSGGEEDVRNRGLVALLPEDSLTHEEEVSEERHASAATHSMEPATVPGSQNPQAESISPGLNPIPTAEIQPIEPISQPIGSGGNSPVPIPSADAERLPEDGKEHRSDIEARPTALLEFPSQLPPDSIQDAQNSDLPTQTLADEQSAEDGIKATPGLPEHEQSARNQTEADPAEDSFRMVSREAAPPGTESPINRDMTTPEAAPFPQSDRSESHSEQRSFSRTPALLRPDAKQSSQTGAADLIDKDKDESDSWSEISNGDMRKHTERTEDREGTELIPAGGVATEKGDQKPALDARRRTEEDISLEPVCFQPVYRPEPIPDVNDSIQPEPPTVQIQPKSPSSFSSFNPSREPSNLQDQPSVPVLESSVPADQPSVPVDLPTSHPPELSPPTAEEPPTEPHISRSSVDIVHTDRPSVLIQYEGDSSADQQRNEECAPQTGLSGAVADNTGLKDNQEQAVKDSEGFMPPVSPQDSFSDLFPAKDPLTPRSASSQDSAVVLGPSLPQQPKSASDSHSHESDMQMETDIHMASRSIKDNKDEQAYDWSSSESPRLLEPGSNPEEPYISPEVLTAQAAISPEPAEIHPINDSKSSSKSSSESDHYRQIEAEDVGPKQETSLEFDTKQAETHIEGEEGVLPYNDEARGKEDEEIPTITEMASLAPATNSVKRERKPEDPSSDKQFLSAKPPLAPHPCPANPTDLAAEKPSNIALQPVFSSSLPPLSPRAMLKPQANNPSPRQASFNSTLSPQSSVLRSPKQANPPPISIFPRPKYPADSLPLSTPVSAKNRTLFSLQPSINFEDLSQIDLHTPSPKQASRKPKPESIDRPSYSQSHLKATKLHLGNSASDPRFLPAIGRQAEPQAHLPPCGNLRPEECKGKEDDGETSDLEEDLEASRAQEYQSLPQTRSHHFGSLENPDFLSLPRLHPPDHFPIQEMKSGASARLAHSSSGNIAHLPHSPSHLLNPLYPRNSFLSLRTTWTGLYHPSLPVGSLLREKLKQKQDKVRSKSPYNPYEAGWGKRVMKEFFSLKLTVEPFNVVPTANLAKFEGRVSSAQPSLLKRHRKRKSELKESQ